MYSILKTKINLSLYKSIKKFLLDILLLQNVYYEIIYYTNHLKYLKKAVVTLLFENL